MPSPPAPPPLTSAPPVRRWNALITIDPSLDPEAAGSHPPQQRRIFPLELAENLIGRRSNSLGVHPEIALDGDPGVSRRHARIFFGPDGAPVLLELGSANGTLLNGQPVEPGAPTPLADGDQLSLGRCTRITIKSY